MHVIYVDHRDPVAISPSLVPERPVPWAHHTLSLEELCALLLLLCLAAGGRRWGREDPTLCCPVVPWASPCVV